MSSWNASCNMYILLYYVYLFLSMFSMLCYVILLYIIFISSSSWILVSAEYLLSICWMSCICCICSRPLESRLSTLELQLRETETEEPRLASMERKLREGQDIRHPTSRDIRPDICHRISTESDSLKDFSATCICLCYLLEFVGDVSDICHICQW